MDTATLTIATADTVTLPAIHTTGRHRRPTLLARVRRYTAGEPVPTVVIILGILLMVAGVVAAAVWPAPVSPGARWDPQPVAVAPVATAVCDTDADCAAWDRDHGAGQAGGPLAAAPHAWLADEGDGHLIVEVDPGYPGDDNHDGVIDEDESGWACWAMGNHRCSPEPLRHRSA